MKNDSHETMKPFIDRDEIEEMLREYYDFECVTDELWSKLDYEIRILCNERGISTEYTEEYVRICDICCERLHFPLSHP